MKLANLTKNIYSESILIEWYDAPANAIGFKVYCAINNAVGKEEWKLLGTTTNIFFNDTINYKNTVIVQSLAYRIDAIDSAGKGIDTLIIPAGKTAPTLLQRTLNILKTKAKHILGNSQWSFDCFVVKPRVSGKKCGACYSRDLNLSAKPDCQLCFGKGYEGGFYTPIPSSLLVRTENTKFKSVNDFKPVAYDIVVCTMPSFPLVMEGDYIFVEKVGRFIVAKTEVNSILTTLTPTMTVTMSLCDGKDIIYKYSLENTKPSITAVYVGAAPDADKVFVEGANLIPGFGITRMIVRDTTNDEYVVYHPYHLINTTSSKLVFRDEDKPYPPRIFSYRIRLNGEIFEGIGTQNT